MVYKSLNDLVPGYLSSKFVKRYETRYSLANSVNKLIGKFRIPDGPGTSTTARLMRVNFFTKTKTNMGNLPRSRWKMIEISKKGRSQSLNFTSKRKGYLLQTTKFWEKLIVLNRRKKKATKPKEQVNLKRVKFVKMTIFYSL